MVIIGIVAPAPSEATTATTSMSLSVHVEYVNILCSDSQLRLLIRGK